MYDVGLPPAAAPAEFLHGFVGSVGGCELLTGRAREICLGIVRPDDPTTIPPFNPPTDSCPAGFRWSVLQQTCVDDDTQRTTPVIPDPDPSFESPAELGPSMHENGHRDHVPAIRDVRTRRCRRGSVLGTDGWCHPKGSIRNADRQYPKPPRPLGTRGDLRAVRTASAFGRRLVANKKRLKKLEQNLKKATC